jgi:hypothetical protein
VFDLVFDAVDGDLIGVVHDGDGIVIDANSHDWNAHIGFQLEKQHCVFRVDLEVVLANERGVFDWR